MRRFYLQVKMKSDRSSRVNCRETATILMLLAGAERVGARVCEWPLLGNDMLSRCHLVLVWEKHRDTFWASVAFAVTNQISSVVTALTAIMPSSAWRKSRGITRSLAGCFHDLRHQDYVDHSVLELLDQQEPGVD